MCAMNFRHEWKHEISRSDLLVLRARLQVVARPDPHGQDGRYRIRSLYFDTPRDAALWEKINGVDRREKFRLRYYGGDSSQVRLEKKCKRGGLCAKESAPLEREEVRAILAGELDWMPDCGRPLVREFFSKLRGNLLRPQTIVDYTREAFVFPAGDVRVTLDSGLRTGLGGTDFLNPECITVPARDAPLLLEVKWGPFLPDIIRDAVQLGSRRAAAFSKYAACRAYE